MSKITPRQILIEARQILIDKGWVPHCGSYTEEGPNCIITAGCVVAARYRHEINNWLDAIREVVGKDIIAFNDRQTSITPILAAFDAAIESLTDEA